MANRVRLKRACPTILAVASLSLFGAQAAAQTSPGPTLPTVEVISDYDFDDVRPEVVTTATRIPAAPRDIPQTIDTIEVNKYKSYGINDLSIMLDGVPGVNTQYDMRGEGVMIRGFSADSNDIYRDGVRESGQVRRSTADVERIEILKGPASVLYGRGSGGGVINMITRQANFDSPSMVNLRAGSWGNRGITADLNHVINENVALRLSADKEKSDSFRNGVRNDSEMFSPSILINNRRGLRWLAQYTHDTVWRVPDRGPAYDQLPDGVSIRTGFAHPDDYVEDRLRVLRSDLSYDFNTAWTLRWVATKREASQDFDHYYGGSYCRPDGRTSTGSACAWPGRVRPSYAWQQTRNETLTHTLDLSGRFSTGGIRHQVLAGMEFTDEDRMPRIGQPPLTADAFTYDPLQPIVWPVKPANGAPTQHNHHEARTRALYLQDLMSVGEHWKVLAGLRYDSYEFRSTNKLTEASRGYDGDSVSPRLGVVWQPARAHSFYAAWNKSFSPYGGRGLLSVSPDPSAVYDSAPQYSRQIEMGVKSDWLDGALSTQLAVFELEHYNIRYRPDPVDDPFTWAVRGSERSRGIELSFAGRLAPSWYIRGGIGLLSAKVVQDETSPGNEGNLLQNTARRNGNLFLRYTPRPSWYGEIGVTHTSARWLNAANTSRLPGYTRWDALIGWRTAPWTVTMAVSNLFDHEYWRSAAMPGAPRSVLVSGVYQF